jgi:hypothetical protein
MVRMSNPDRPHFDLSTRAHIEAVQSSADSELWGKLEKFMVPNVMEKRPLSKFPAALCLCIAGYARTLYIAEGNHYQQNPLLEIWLNKLAKRIVNRAMGVVREVEEYSRKQHRNLWHHGATEAKMRKAAFDELNDLISKRLAPPLAFSPPLPPPAIEKTLPALTGKQAAAYAEAGIDLASASPLLMMAHDAAQNAQKQPKPLVHAPRTESTLALENPSVIERRAKLLAEYQAATSVTEYAIYMGNSGIYKPQFLKWKAGILPVSSSTTQNFERFLREKKAPTPRKRKK